VASITEWIGVSRSIASSSGSDRSHLNGLASVTGVLRSVGSYDERNHRRRETPTPLN
jgi:hypothetical protein